MKSIPDITDSTEVGLWDARLCCVVRRGSLLEIEQACELTDHEANVVRGKLAMSARDQGFGFATVRDSQFRIYVVAPFTNAVRFVLRRTA